MREMRDAVNRCIWYFTGRYYSRRATWYVLSRQCDCLVCRFGYESWHSDSCFWSGFQSSRYRDVFQIVTIDTMRCRPLSYAEQQRARGILTGTFRTHGKSVVLGTRPRYFIAGAGILFSRIEGVVGVPRSVEARIAFCNSTSSSSFA